MLDNALLLSIWKLLDGFLINYTTDNELLDNVNMMLLEIRKESKITIVKFAKIYFEDGVKLIRFAVTLTEINKHVAFNVMI